MMKPSVKPADPRFSSGPTSKRPDWSLSALEGASLGRSHRSVGGKAKLNEVISRSVEMLGIPSDYKIGIMPASDTGAFEAALWSLLGARGVDVLVYEAFSKGWAADIVDHLGLEDVRVMTADYGALPDLAAVDFTRDVVFAWNGTTSGVRVPEGEWIDEGREGLVICDATSAVFAMELPWEKLDVVTWSWQKVMGGEAAHGMIALSPRAVERLETYVPDWPLPKIFRMVKNGKLNEGIFRGVTINTPSMLCVEDALDGLKWAEEIGGLPALIGRVEANFAAVAAWVDASDWVDFLAEEREIASPSAICLKIVHPDVKEEDKASIIVAMKKLLEDEGAAFDIGAYKDAPAGLRLWGGATVDVADFEAVLPWLDWGFRSQKV